jgi:hypothetical protein
MTWHGMAECPAVAVVWCVCVLQYAHYDTLPEILGRFMRFMKEVGEAEQQPATGTAAAQLAQLSRI